MTAFCGISDNRINPAEDKYRGHINEDQIQSLFVGKHGIYSIRNQEKTDCECQKEGNNLPEPPGKIEGVIKSALTKGGHPLRLEQCLHPDSQLPVMLMELHRLFLYAVLHSLVFCLLPARPDFLQLFLEFSYLRVITALHLFATFLHSHADGILNCFLLRLQRFFQPQLLHLELFFFLREIRKLRHRLFCIFQK